MIKRIVLITVSVLLACAVVFALVVGGFLAYWVWSADRYQDSLEDTPEVVGLSEWESDTLPKITLHIGDAGGSYCTIAEKDYRVIFISERDKRDISFYELIDGWYRTDASDGEVLYTDGGTGDQAYLFGIIDFDYQDTEFIVFIEPRTDDIFAGKVFKITFTRK